MKVVIEKTDKRLKALLASGIIGVMIGIGVAFAHPVGWMLFFLGWAIIFIAKTLIWWNHG